MAGSATKAQLINMLYFPRQLVQEELHEALSECPHELRFACDDIECLTCDLEDECRWLNENDDFAPLHLRPIPRLVDALSAAISYVRGDAIAWGHADYCSCQVCEWLLKAQAMYDSAELTDAGHVSHQTEHVKAPRLKNNFRNNSLWRFLPIRESAAYQTNMRVHLLRTFQPK